MTKSYERNIFYPGEKFQCVGNGIKIKEGYVIEFYTCCNSDRKLFSGEVKFKENFGFIVIVDGVSYEVVKLIDIKIISTNKFQNPKDLKRNIWIPNMTQSKLEKLLSKPVEELTNDDKEDLIDFKYFMLNQKFDAFEKNLLVAYNQDGEEPVFVPRNKFWVTNIDNATKDFKSKYWIQKELQVSEIKEKLENETGLKIGVRKNSVSSSMRGYVTFYPKKQKGKWLNWNFEYSRYLLKYFGKPEPNPTFVSNSSLDVYIGDKIY